MESPRIRVLPPEVAKRIAAGEVIDRPAAALRELLDNAIDSGASSIIVELEGGGIDRVRVSDDGVGMGREDLELSVFPHATSKIASLDDLDTLSTLGFRGEALSSMAAVAGLEITSATRDDEAWKLESTPGRSATISPSRGSRGTAVTVTDLFASFPARRKFLKRPAAEAAACRVVLVDKAMAYPGVAFRLVFSGKPILSLPPAGLVERVLAAAAPEQAPELFRELVASGRGFSAKLVAGLPAIYRTDRRHVQVFINGRRVQEYGVAQAIEYAYRGSMPGGAWPIAYAFIVVDPAYADFNIHPAKREVRLKNLDDIRSGLIRALRDYLGSQARVSAPLPPASLFDIPGGARARSDERESPLSYSAIGGKGGLSAFEKPGSSTDRSSWDAIADELSRARSSGALQTAEARPEPERLPFRYLGRALGVFLAFETGDEIVLMDQHAAHERYLYEELMAGRAVSQELLVPVVYEPVSDDEDAYIGSHADELLAAGFRLTRDGGTWLLEAAPAMMPEAMTGAIFELLRSRPDPAELLREIAATAACKAAIKDGDELDETGAVALIRAALELPEPRCPHGRPIWLRLSREALFRAVRRIV
ncbi:MAG: DNA mismatch repair endonuclease MutL [Spirochaetales bacterium]|nr:DNA mismatch repair endonuclease MutL [Spirochaetales bacterium]